MNKYKIIAICGKSAAGKDTFLQYMIQQPNTHEVISCTTRPPREGEVHGKNYYFISEEEFFAMVNEAKMLEYTHFRDWFYGTATNGLDPNEINIGVFNPEGVNRIREIPFIDVFVVMIAADDKMRLLRSLNREENPDVKEIVRRYLEDEEDFEDFKGVNFFLANNGQGIDPKKAEAVAERILEEAKCFWAKEVN